MRREFIQVSEDEDDFLRSFQRLVQKKHGLQKVPPLGGIIRGILRDYRRVLEDKAAPNFLDTYRLEMKRRRRKSKKLS